MDICSRIAQRFGQINRGYFAQVAPVRTSGDGHGNYALDVMGHGKHLVKQIFLSVPEARSLGHGKNNPNLDSALRL